MISWLISAVNALLKEFLLLVICFMRATWYNSSQTLKTNNEYFKLLGRDEAKFSCPADPSGYYCEIKFIL